MIERVKRLWKVTLAGTAVAYLGMMFAPSDAEGRTRSTYATCYQLKGKTASGTYVNKRTAAHNFMWPGTKIRLVGQQAGPNGVRRYIVRDTGPALRDGHLDLWAESGCLRYGRRSVRFKIGWAR